MTSLPVHPYDGCVVMGAGQQTAVVEAQVTAGHSLAMSTQHLKGNLEPKHTEPTHLKGNLEPKHTAPTHLKGNLEPKHTEPTHLTGNLEPKLRTNTPNREPGTQTHREVTHRPFTGNL